ncbi:proteasome activator subunit 4-like protein, partial [Tanacetum coccineum]
RVHTAAILVGLMKGKDGELSKDFCERAYSAATKLQKRRKHKLVSSIYMIKRNGGPLIASIHGRVLALAACVLLVPYDMPSWLPEHTTLLAYFFGEPSTVNSIVTKSFAEFYLFTEEQLEVIKWKTIAICIVRTKVISAKYLIKTNDDAFVHVDEVLASLNRVNMIHGLLYSLINPDSQPHQNPDSKSKLGRRVKSL